MVGFSEKVILRKINVNTEIKYLLRRDKFLYLFLGRGQVNHFHILNNSNTFPKSYTGYLTLIILPRATRSACLFVLLNIQLFICVSEASCQHRSQKVE